MISCPVCQSEVEKLKTNSHIIPRWMLASIKDDGKFVSISEDKLKERDQSDPKADMVCGNCENLFRDCDTFSAQFFRDRSFFVETVKSSRGSETLFYEKYNKNSKALLIKFAASLFLRGHLYKKQTTCDGTLGPYFGKLAEQFISGVVSSMSFPTVMFFYSSYEKVHTLPQKSKFDGFNCQEAIIFGYRIFMFTDKRGLPDYLEEIAKQEEVLVPKIQGTQNKFTSDLMDLVSKHKKS